MNGQQLNVNVDPDKIDAKFCDQVFMSNSAFGFMFDFLQQIPQMKTTRMLSRIGMSPQHAKIFSEILSNGVKQYEGLFGEIKLTTRMKDEASQQIGFHKDIAEEEKKK